MKKVFFTKKFLAGCVVAAVAAVATFNVALGSSSKTNLSGLEFSNVEALAGNEAGDPGIVIYCRCTDGNVFGGNKQCKARGVFL